MEKLRSTKVSEKKTTKEKESKTTKEKDRKTAKEKDRKTTKEKDSKTTKEKDSKTAKEKNKKIIKEELKSIKEEELKSAKEKELKSLKEKELKSLKEKELKSAKEKELKSTNEKELKSTNEKELKSTKEKIIYESLNLFSQKGYDGVSMRDIAAAVGIKGASIYNHFKSKEEIFNAIIEEMSSQYDHIVKKLKIPSGEIEDIANDYMKLTSENLEAIAQGLFIYFLKDDFAGKFRKMLIAEQYRNERARVTLQNYFYDMPINFQTELFRTLIHQGAFRKYDPHIMALHFYGPIFLLLNEYEDHKKIEEVKQLIRKHVQQFSQIYHQ